MDAALTKRVAAPGVRGAAVDIDRTTSAEFGKRLRAWYRRNARDLPWRKTRDAHRILVSELMLQQTQVSRVVTYYGEFLERFPTLAHVARAEPARVTEAWEGLGYYARARNLHKLARQVTDDGRAPDRTLPPDAAALRELPGVGAYTAGAVSSFAYERRAPLVDTNVARVLQRVFAPSLQIKSTKGQRALWSIAESILPRTGGATWTHNQALMELGALVCTARVAHCGRCPVRSLCRTATKAAAKTAARNEGAGRGSMVRLRSRAKLSAASRP